MPDDHPIRDGSIVDLVGGSVRRDVLHFENEPTVTIGRPVTPPLPAFVGSRRFALLVVCECLGKVLPGWARGTCGLPLIGLRFTVEIEIPVVAFT